MRALAISVRFAAALAAFISLSVWTGGAMAQSAAPASYLLAQSADPFSALVGKRRQRRNDNGGRVKIERYVLASDDRVFLFEEHANEARVKFLCAQGDPRLDCTLDEEGPAPEIYRLWPTRGPRGDLIYKNAQGDTLLRIASYGGATVFWPGAAQGFAASKSFGDDAALRLSAASYETALRRAQAATARISAVTGMPIVFNIGAPASGEDASVLADSVMLTAKGVKDVADDPTGARIIASRIDRIVFLKADAPGVSLNESALEIRYAPGLDIAGRPSSVTVARFLEETL